MSKVIEAHVGSWSGDLVYLTIPDFTPPTKKLQNLDVKYSNASSDIAQYTDPNYTFFAATEEYAEYLRLSGCSNVIVTNQTSNDSAPIDYYINESNYIRVSYSGTVSTGKRIYLQYDYRKGATKVTSNSYPGQYGTIFNCKYGQTGVVISRDTLDQEAQGIFNITVNPASSLDWKGFWDDVTEKDSDPYSEGGNSGTGGGTGTFSGTGDSIEFPGLPMLSAVSTGFITLFNPSIAQMQSLASYMWSDLFDLDTFKKIFADPMDCILGLSIVPVAVPNGGTAEVKVGNISTGVSMTVASTQYVEVDCGTLNVQEYWGSYLDYDPYTKAEIYLPYCGTHPIAVDDIMGKSVHVKYHVDILSGACVAYVKCGSSILYSFIGQCTSSIPITGNDWTNVVNGAISIASAIGSMVATGGATAPLVMPGVASTAVNSLKPSVEKSGSMSGTGGMLAVQTPYLILTRPRQALPKNQNTYTGYPSFIKEKLSDLKGYTEVAEIRLSGVDATDAELDEIVGLLKGGVII